MDNFDKLVFVDTETTGGNLENDRVIDIGLVRVENGVITRTFTSLIDPQQHVPEFIHQMTGIDKAGLESAPTFRQIADEISEIMEGCVFVAHNVKFDYNLVKAEFLRLGKKFKMKQLCTVRLSKSLLPEENKHNLDAVIERYGIICLERHRAMPDAQAVCDFFFKARNKYGDKLFFQAIKLAMKHPNLPAALDEEQIEDLPEEPGVYIFYGRNNLPIYIGKSINIKERVKSHFSDANRIQTEMILAQNVASITTQITGGELGALLKEKELITKEKPLFNKKLREIKQLAFLTKDKTGEYDSLTIVSGAWPEGEILGVFKSKQKAKEFAERRTRKFRLCRKVMKLEKMRDRCFDRDLGKCRGACEGKESAIAYNIRFAAAFADSKIKSWPFKGPILIKEKHDQHVFDKWCYLGTINEVADDLPELNFDLDTYKILLSYINRQTNWKKIKVWPAIPAGGSGGSDD